MLKKYIDMDKAVHLLLNNNLTIRDIARVMHISKSSMHTKLHKHMQVLTIEERKEIQYILNKRKQHHTRFWRDKETQK